MVIALAGRRIDAPDAENPRFPPSNESAVAAKLEAVFKDNKASVLVSAAACGADVIAQEVAMRLGMGRRVVLPFAVAEFRKASVTDRPGDWGPRFDRVLRDAPVKLLGFAPDDKEVYRKTNIAILEEAISRGQTKVVIVWEGQSRGSTDYTAHFRSEAEARGIPVIEVRTI